jgi:4-amino-4-deoxy-L-arabinose transferase
MNSHPTLDHFYLLLISGLLLFSSLLFFYFSKTKWALKLLFIGVLFLGFFMALLDPFLHLWDEQYHALVAKNMISDPLKPMLYNNPILDYNYQNWTYNHIWLHKQPLFLWQMAISIKTFGLSAVSVRIPSILMHAITTLMIYKIGKISLNERVGFYAALFFGVSHYFLELISGKLPTEHNDTAFLFYVVASFWAWFEYKETNKNYWLILIGLFSGCAILVKWLVGLLIYSGWFTTLLFEKDKQWLKIRSYYPLLISFVVTLIVVLPWQIYIYESFPMEATHEFQKNSDHFFKVVENHTGDSWFHFNALNQLYGYGDLVPFVLILGLLIYFYKMTIISYKTIMVTSISIVYIFFTLAATKLTSFTIIVCPFIFIGLGTLIDVSLTYLESKIKRNWIVILMKLYFVSFISYLLFNLSQIEINHSFKDPDKKAQREIKMLELEQFKTLNQYLNGEKYVVFNLKSSFQCHISFMYFYDYIAYDYLPNSEQIERLHSLEYKIAVIESESIPDYIYQTPGLKMIPLSK